MGWDKWGESNLVGIYARNENIEKKKNVGLT